jgi:hypothetical protein
LWTLVDLSKILLEMGPELVRVMKPVDWKRLLIHNLQSQRVLGPFELVIRAGQAVTDLKWTWSSRAMISEIDAASPAIELLRISRLTA